MKAKKIQRNKTAANVADNLSFATVFLLGISLAVLLDSTNPAQESSTKNIKLIGGAAGASTTLIFTLLLKWISYLLNQSVNKDRSESVEGEGVELLEQGTNEKVIDITEARSYLKSIFFRNLSYGPICYAGMFLDASAEAIRQLVINGNQRRGSVPTTPVEDIVITLSLGTVALITSGLAFFLAKKNHNPEEAEKIEQWMYQNKKGLKDLFSIWKNGQPVRFTPNRFEEIPDEDEQLLVVNQGKKEIPLTGADLERDLAEQLNGVPPRGKSIFGFGK